jgi:dTDP-4-dehydrorhamnose 3,5-epimerase
MEIRPLKLEGSYEITLAPRVDARGSFTRIYDEQFFQSHGLQTNWVQENESRSLRKHLIRGLHYQREPYAETKLVRVIMGTIWDVFVDLRKESPTHGQWDALELSESNSKMVYIPRGFAHGFCTMTEQSVVQYKVDSSYAPQWEGGIRWNDATLNIAWPTRDPFLSDRDKALPFLAQVGFPF